MFDKSIFIPKGAGYIIRELRNLFQCCIIAEGSLVNQGRERFTKDLGHPKLGYSKY